MSTKPTITTSFPLGLFCNATLSGHLPQAKPVEPPAVTPKTAPKMDFLAPLDLPAEGLDEDLSWNDESA